MRNNVTSKPIHYPTKTDSYVEDSKKTTKDFIDQILQELDTSPKTLDKKKKP